MTDDSRTFLIVHGAGSGGWLWRDVRRRLQSLGHEVYTPTLTGVGERAHLAGPDIDLSTHIQDITGALDYEDLHNVVLVGHSYGGMVITGVADRVPERLSRLVYIDAFVPSDGDSVLTFVPPPIRAAWEQQAAEGDGWRLPPLPHGHLGRIAGDGLSEEQVKALLDRRVPQPFKTYTEPIHLSNPLAAALPATYIYCADKPPGDPFAHLVARLNPRIEVRNIDTGHFPMLTSPGQLCEMLLQVAGSR